MSDSHHHPGQFHHSQETKHRPRVAKLSDEEIFAAHTGGKLATVSRRPLESVHDLSVAYTPGVARVCEELVDHPERAHELTWTGRTVAVISDGTAVLGLGNIGPTAALPVMEGKAQLFGRFGGVNAVPVVLDTTDVDEIITAVKAIAPSYGAINLEDIGAPRCFEIERRLDEALDIPVMHDDQHGTAVVIMAALKGACKLTGRKLEDLKIVVTGAGAAGVACIQMLRHAGVTEIIAVDSKGIIGPDRTNLNDVKQKLAAITNPRGVTGDLAEAMKGADTFIGVSCAHVDEEHVKLMADGPILFPLANPTPEIDPEVAYRHGSVVATGRSDLPNQINNVLAFPGIFRGALDAQATAITPAMLLAASDAIAAIAADEISEEYIIPSPLDGRVAPAVAQAVANAANMDH